MGAKDSEKTEKKDIPGDVPNLDDAVSWHVVSRSLIKHVPFWFPKKTRYRLNICLGSHIRS